MKIMLFGLPGCGKTTIGKIISKKYKLSYIEGDNFLTKEIILSLKKNRRITDKMRNSFYAKITDTLKNKDNFVFVDATPKDKYRKIFQKIHPDIIMIYISVKTNVGLIRINHRKNHIINKNAFDKITLYFEKPKIKCFRADNNKSIAMTISKIRHIINSTQDA